MKNIGIEPSHFEKILELFKSHPEIEKVTLFGSRAKGNFKESSDIDLALFGKNLNNTILNDIKLEYENLYLPWKLDLVHYDSIENKELQQHIDRVGLVV